MTNEELVAQIKAGENVQENMGQLYEQNRNYICQIAVPFSRIAELDDLMQEAYFGLEKAVQKYDPALGYKFLTYAESWIRQAIQRYIQNTGNIKRIPVYTLERISKYQKFSSDFRAITGKEPSDSDCCAYLKISPGQLKELRKYMVEGKSVSIYDPIPGTDDVVLGDTIADEFDLEETVVDDLAGDTLWDAVDDLGGRYPAIIRGEYQRNQTLEVTASQLGISIERVRILKKRAIQLLERDKRVKQLAEVYGYNCGQTYHWGIQRFANTNTSSTEFLALKHIEHEESQKDMAVKVQDLKAVTDLAAEQIKQDSGYVPSGILRLQELNRKIETMIQERMAAYQSKQ